MNKSGGNFEIIFVKLEHVVMFGRIRHTSINLSIFYARVSGPIFECLERAEGPIVYHETHQKPPTSALQHDRFL